MFSTQLSFPKPQRPRRGSLDRIAFTSRASVITKDSLMNTMREREQTLTAKKLKFHQMQRELEVKGSENVELSRNLQTIKQFATSQRIEATKKREEVVLLKAIQSKKDQDINKLIQQLKDLRNKIQLLQGQKQELVNERDLLVKKSQRIGELEVLLSEKQQHIEKITKEKDGVAVQAADTMYLRERIKRLELQLREAKLYSQQLERRKMQVEKQKLQLAEALRRTKPDAERQQERIRYYERITVDMQRKMEDYTRRENEYMRTIQSLRKELDRTIKQKDNFWADLTRTKQELTETTRECKQWREKHQVLQQQHNILQEGYKQVEEKCAKLQQKLIDTQNFYAEQNKQNHDLTTKNKNLIEHLAHERHTIEHYKQLSETVNLNIQKKDLKLQQQTENILSLQKKMQELLKQYQRFETLYQESTDRARTELREVVHNTFKTNSRLDLDYSDLRRQHNRMLMEFGQQRDSLRRDLEMRKLEAPTETNIYFSIFKDKNEEMRILENSNQQLLKIRQGLEDELEAERKRVQELMKELNVFKIKMIDLYRLTKENEDLKEKEKRHIQMINDAKNENRHLEEQIAALREKSRMLADSLFTAQNQIRNKGVEIASMKQVISDLDVKTLEAKKRETQKKAFMMQDIVEKMHNAVVSMQVFFSCCQCDELLEQPITVVPCGHHYCVKCTEGYEDYCIQCHTGLPIDKVFNDKLMKETMAKYHFFRLIFQEAQEVFIKNKKR